MFDEPVSPMYVWAILLVLLLAGISSYVSNVFPFSLVVAVLVALAAELGMRAYLKHKQRMPFSAIITGIIVGSIAPQNAPFLLVTLASLIAILSKYFIKVRHNPVFNPAALGLIIGLAIFGVGDVWWAAGSYSVSGFTFSLAPLLIIAAYQGRRLHASIAFLIAILLMSVGLTGVSSITSLNGVDALVFGVNFYFAFLMLADPKTSPHRNSVQVVYGAGVALLYSGFALYRLPYAFLLALLVGNLAYAVYRMKA